jgi:hypothetical protein
MGAAESLGTNVLLPVNRALLFVILLLVIAAEDRGRKGLGVALGGARGANSTRRAPSAVLVTLGGAHTSRLVGNVLALLVSTHGLVSLLVSAREHA